MGVHNARGRFWPTFLSVLGFSALVLLVVLAIALQGIPRLMGGSSLTVLSGSMEPTISPGDIVVVRAIEPADVRVGDVITFQPVSGDPTLVTHRVISMGVNTQDGIVFVTRGDANGAPDDPILGEQIRGVLVYTVPYVGSVLALAGGAGPAIVIALGAGLLAFAVFALWPRRRRDGRDQEGREGGSAAAGLLVVLALAAASVALPVSSARAADGLGVDWDGPTVHLNARGQPYSTLEASFFGDRTVVPGDQVRRSVLVQNNGPADGLLSVRLRDFLLTGVAGLDQRVTLSWTTSGANGAGVISDLAGPDDTLVDGVRLARGESLIFTLTLDFPVGATDGNRASDDRTVLDFDVDFFIVETDPSPTPPGVLPRTGGLLASGAIVGGLVLVSLGTTLVLTRRRRDGDLTR